MQKCVLADKTLSHSSTIVVLNSEIAAFTLLPFQSFIFQDDQLQHTDFLKLFFMKRYHHDLFYSRQYQ